MASECKGKNSWPELVGTNGDFAVSVIERQNPRVNAGVVLEGSPVTADFRCDRVRVVVNVNRVVVEVPTIG